MQHFSAASHSFFSIVRGSLSHTNFKRFPRTQTNKKRFLFSFLSVILSQKKSQPPPKKGVALNNCFLNTWSTIVAVLVQYKSKRMVRRRNHTTAIVGTVPKYTLFFFVSRCLHCLSLVHFHCWLI